jgi:hypothetical protein
VSYERKTTDTRPGGSLVDDRTTGTTDNNNNIEPIPSSVTELTQEEDGLVTRMEEIIQFFLDLLQVTGGDLAPENRSPLEKERYKTAWINFHYIEVIRTSIGH